jgi:hypothetical protein
LVLIQELNKKAMLLRLKLLKQQQSKHVKPHCNKLQPLRLKESSKQQLMLRN